MSKTLIGVILALLASVSGVLLGALTALYMRFLYQGIDFLWNSLPTMLGVQGNIPLYTIVMCIVGGVLVGLCQKHLGDHPKQLQESMAAFRRTGRFDYQHLRHGLATATVSLFFGASLGPEAALMDMVGSLGTWVGDQLKRVASILHFNRDDSAEYTFTRSLKWALISMAVLAGIGGFIALSGDMLHGGIIQLETDFSIHCTELGFAIPAAFAGAVGGILYVFFAAYLPKASLRFSHRPILRSVAGGLLFGILAAVFPLVLFSGQNEMQLLLSSHGSQLAWIILITGLAKLIAVPLLFSAGWKGGPIMPVMFGGAAIGLAVALWIPGASPIVGFIAGMAGATAVVLPMVGLAPVVLLLMMPIQSAGVVLIGSTIGYLVEKVSTGRIIRCRPNMQAEAA